MSKDYEPEVTILTECGEAWLAHINLYGTGYGATEQGAVYNLIGRFISEHVSQEDLKLLIEHVNAGLAVCKNDKELLKLLEGLKTAKWMSSK